MFPSRLPRPVPDDDNHKAPPHQNYYSLRRHSHYPMGNDDGCSGLPSSNDDENSNNTATNKTPTKIQNKYYPKIYSYKCYGKYTTSSNGYGGNGGKCHGIAKAITTLYNEPVRMSRIEALQRFTSMNSDVDLDDYNHHHHHGDSNHGDDNKGTNSDGAELSEQAVYLSPALIYQNEHSENVKSDSSSSSCSLTDPTQQSTTNKATAAVVQYYDDRLLEEEVILEQDWTCYGVTDVEYLSLEDVRTGVSKLVAVAPRNTGVSIRNIETEDHLRSLTRCSLGWIDILHDSNSVLGYEDDDVENEAKNYKNDDKNATTKESLADMMKNKNSDTSIDEQIRQTPSILTELHIPKDVESIMKIGQEHMNRTIEFSKLVSTHMQYNVQWLYGNLRDDFPHRTVEAGKRCVQQIPKTIDGTMTAMQQIFQQLIRGRDDDNDDNDDYPPAGGRRF